SGTALVQTVGRAARNVHGKVIMYADKQTDAMRYTLDETNRRRVKQMKYNQEHNIEPASIVKAIHDITSRLSAPAMVSEERGEYRAGGKTVAGMPLSELKRLMSEMEKEMKQAAKDLEFEKAAALRDQLYELRAMMAEETDVSPWKKVRLLSGEELPE
ncbi:MAG: UvrB/UvrC motif-containing protein, partial [Anaerolineaceae bacterium]